MLHLYEVKYVGPQRPGSPERHWFELRTAKVMDEVMDGWAVRYIGSYETEEQATHMVDDLLDGDYRDPYDYDDYYEDEGTVRVYIADKNEHLSDEATREWMMPGAWKSWYSRKHRMWKLRGSRRIRRIWRI
jgi:hypothetical protein